MLVDHVVQVVVDVVLLAELAGEGQTGEALQPVQVNGINIKPDDEGGKEPEEDQQGQSDQNPLAVHVGGPEGEVGQEGEGEQQAAQEAEDVGDVVDPGQQAAQEQEEHDGQELQERLPGPLQHLPGLEELHEEAG